MSLKGKVAVVTGGNGGIGLGFAGEIRKVTGINQRVSEAARLGFKRAIVPMGSDLKIAGIEILEAARLEQAISKVKIN